MLSGDARPAMLGFPCRERRAETILGLELYPSGDADPTRLSGLCCSTPDLWQGQATPGTESESESWSKPELARWVDGVRDRAESITSEPTGIWGHVRVSQLRLIRDVEKRYLETKIRLVAKRETLL